MKTILYQPLFINPQAYFVFPQLYHIEKGDSYIEPANITGQLIINDLTQSLTSTPILNVVQDTNQVDFGLFKGKHIRISQYTNIGAVVLGEWYIPGTPTPPEPEQPDWFKESIVAWYSPYCKQRMTNFDVIEAYTEDFTKWAYRNSRGTAKITNNTIVITNVVETNNIVEDDNEPYSDLTIRVTGVTENKYLIVRQGRGKPETHIKKDGVYTFKDNNLYFGFGVSVIGECNITITQLPTSILKDFSDNGNHAYLYGGKGKLNSGMGVYNEDFTTYTVQFDNNKPYEQYYNKVIIHNSDNYISNFWKNVNEPPLGQKEYSGFKLKISGLPKNSKVNIRVYYGDDYSQIKTIEAITDEIVVIPKTTANVITANKTFTYIDFNLARYKNTITIEQIPDYPDQLCYDGKMYAVAYDMPILTDYTIIADRTILDNSDIADWAFISKRDYPAINGAFSFEKDIDDTSDNLRTISFGRTSVIYKPIKERSISYQTKNKYNGQDIIAGNVDDVDFLLIGAGMLDTNLNLVKEKMRVSHGNILLFNRTLTEYEISWVKNNMMCSKQQEPDIDL